MHSSRGSWVPDLSALAVAHVSLPFSGMLHQHAVYHVCYHRSCARCATYLCLVPYIPTKPVTGCVKVGLGFDQRWGGWGVRCSQRWQGLAVKSAAFSQNVDHDCGDWLPVCLYCCKPAFTCCRPLKAMGVLVLMYVFGVSTRGGTRRCLNGNSSTCWSSSQCMWSVESLDVAEWLLQPLMASQVGCVAVVVCLEYYA